MAYESGLTSKRMEDFSPMDAARSKAGVSPLASVSMALSRTPAPPPKSIGPAEVPLIDWQARYVPCSSRCTLGRREDEAFHEAWFTFPSCYNA